MKSSLALIIEQLLRLEPFCELHLGVEFPFVVLSLSVCDGAGAALAGAVCGSAVGTGGGEVWRGVNKELNGTSGMTKSSSLTVTGLLTANAPTLIVSLNEVLLSSLKNDRLSLKWNILWRLSSHATFFMDIIKCKFEFTDIRRMNEVVKAMNIIILFEIWELIKRSCDLGA